MFLFSVPIQNACSYPFDDRVEHVGVGRDGEGQEGGDLRKIGVEVEVEVEFFRRRRPSTLQLIEAIVPLLLSFTKSKARSIHNSPRDIQKT